VGGSKMKTRVIVFLIASSIVFLSLGYSLCYFEIGIVSPIIGMVLGGLFYGYFINDKAKKGGQNENGKRN
jgi:hypothetical protein